MKYRRQRSNQKKTAMPMKEDGREKKDRIHTDRQILETCHQTERLVLFC